MNAKERRQQKRQGKLLGAIGRERAIQAALERAGETIRGLEADQIQLRHQLASQQNDAAYLRRRLKEAQDERHQAFEIRDKAVNDAEGHVKTLIAGITYERDMARIDSGLARSALVEAEKERIAAVVEVETLRERVRVLEDADHDSAKLRRRLAAKTEELEQMRREVQKARADLAEFRRAFVPSSFAAGAQ